MFPVFHSETAFTRNKLPSSKQICFVCNTSRKDDSKSYNFGGLGKCMEDGAAAKLQECLFFLIDPNQKKRYSQEET